MKRTTPSKSSNTRFEPYTDILEPYYKGYTYTIEQCKNKKDLSMCIKEYIVQFIYHGHDKSLESKVNSLITPLKL